MQVRVLCRSNSPTEGNVRPACTVPSKRWPPIRHHRPFTTWRSCDLPDHVQHPARSFDRKINSFHIRALVSSSTTGRIYISFRINVMTSLSGWQGRGESGGSRCAWERGVWGLVFRQHADPGKDHVAETEWPKGKELQRHIFPHLTFFPKFLPLSTLCLPPSNPTPLYWSADASADRPAKLHLFLLFHILHSFSLHWGITLLLLQRPQGKDKNGE